MVASTNAEDTAKIRKRCGVDVGETPAPQWPLADRGGFAGKVWCARLARMPIFEGYEVVSFHG
jgi:hypothetical protein